MVVVQSSSVALESNKTAWDSQSSAGHRAPRAEGFAHS